MSYRVVSFDGLQMMLNNACRTQGKGLYGLGGTCLAMFPLQAVSERGAEIEKNLPTGSDTPGLAEQYVEQRKRIEEGAACLEIIPEPGFIGGPSNYVVLHIATVVDV